MAELAKRREQQLELGIQSESNERSSWEKLRDWWLPVEHVLYDRTLVWLAFGLLAFGFVMVSSASFPIAERLTDNPFHFVIRHSMYLALGIGLLATVVQIPVDWWMKGSFALLFGALGALLLVLIVGHEVNGARRWIKVGPMTLQVAEVAKLCFLVYLSSYLKRYMNSVQENLREFIKPLAVMSIFAVLLLMQPDFGSVAVMVSIAIGMLFLAGARLWQFFAMLIALAAVLTLLIIQEPYRMKRVTSFLDPWQDPFGSGYQLTQSLMAFGRGDWLGQGLGNSIQKLQYLPEAHTDFIMAVVGEELGFVGIIGVLLAVFAIVLRALWIGRRALRANASFGAFIAYGIGIWFAFQALVNIGAAAGMLPTKGLTLPLISYGGTSLLVSCIALGLLLRIDYEVRVATIKVARGVGKTASARRRRVRT